MLIVLPGAVIDLYCLCSVWVSKIKKIDLCIVDVFVVVVFVVVLSMKNVWIFFFSFFFFFEWFSVRLLL